MFQMKIFYFGFSLPETKYLESGEKPASRIWPVFNSLIGSVILQSNLPSKGSIKAMVLLVVPSIKYCPLGENFRLRISASTSSMLKIEKGLSL